MIRADWITIQKSMQVFICTGPPVSRKCVNLRSGNSHVSRDACRRGIDGKILAFLSSVVYYFGDQLKSANMALIRHKTFIGL